MFSSSRTKAMEILLVEDGLTDAKVTIHALRETHIHHRLTLVRCLDEAREFLSRTGIFARAPQPDLMLLDMLLPDGNGTDLLRELPNIQGFSSEHTTVVVLTASDDQEKRQQCVQMGVTDYIAKPVRQEEFLRVVQEHKRLMIHRTPMIQGPSEASRQNAIA